MGALKKVGLIVLTLFIPPLGVFFVAGCGVDLLINILLTILGYIPGHIHAFYLEYVYFKRREEIRSGVYNGAPAPGVYSSKVQRGGMSENAVATPATSEPMPPAQGQPGQQYGAV